MVWKRPKLYSYFHQVFNDTVAGSKAHVYPIVVALKYKNSLIIYMYKSELIEGYGSNTFSNIIDSIRSMHAQFNCHASTVNNMMMYIKNPYASRLK